MIDDDTTINVFALPGGQVLVFVGLLQTMNIEAVLATAMAYEVLYALRLGRQGDA